MKLYYNYTTLFYCYNTHVYAFAFYMPGNKLRGMPKAKAVTNAERDYLERRLAPVLLALRENETLREEFLLFVQQRGGSMSLTLERLKTVWWPSRKSMYPGFFVLALVEFGLMRGLFDESPSTPKVRRK